MSYLVLARKWRPKTFSQVVGQQHVLQALINGLDQNRLHHAFLFSGTRGVGKTTLARIFAKSLNCEQGVSSTPCGECSSCQEVDAGRFVDLIEVDAASRTKVDDTRELLENVQYAPSRGRYKVYLIDEVHMLSTSSFNALLKTLEEPPPHVKFLFATTDPQKLPITILSRCLQFNLRRLDLQQISSHLATIVEAENVEYEPSALTALAKAADGSMRDALSLLDQAISHSNGKITSQHVIEMLGIVPQKQLINILLSLAEGHPQALIEQCHEMGMQGLDFTHVLDELLSALQRIATLQLIDNLQVSDWDDSEELKQIASSLSPEMTQLYYQIALHGKRDLPYAANPQSGFEMTLLRMLSFRPSEQNISSDTVVAVKKPDDTPPPAPSPQPKPEQIKQPAKTVAPKPREKKVSSKQTTETELNSENWLTIINGLKLTALARQFADNCAFIEYQNQQITLTIAPELAHLASVKNQERLTASISQYLGQDVKLRLENTNSQQSTTTAASKRGEQAEIAQQRANDSIHNDPTVDALKEAFAARIIESTIKPINLEE